MVKFGGVLPAKLEIQALYVPVHPAPDGEQFELQLKIIPVVGSPFQGSLFWKVCASRTAMGTEARATIVASRGASPAAGGRRGAIFTAPAIQA